MVWQGVPEVVCHGTSPEIGLCHGTVARDRIRMNIENYTILYEETANIKWSQAYRGGNGRHRTGRCVDLLDIVALNIRSEISLTNFPDEASDGWTSLGQASDAGNGGVFVAQNWHWTAEAADATVLMDIRRTTDGTPRIQMFGEAGLVAKFGFNDRGLALYMNAFFPFEFAI